MKINTKHGKCNIVVEYDKGVTNRQEHYANHWDRDNSIHGWYIKPSFTVIFKSDVYDINFDYYENKYGSERLALMGIRKVMVKTEEEIAEDKDLAEYKRLKEKYG